MVAEEVLSRLACLLMARLLKGEVVSKCFMSDRDGWGHICVCL